MCRLSEVKKGKKVRIMRLLEGCSEKAVLMGIGLLPGDEIEVVGESFLGSPLAISFGDNEMVAMRLSQADQIFVEELS